MRWPFDHEYRKPDQYLALALKIAFVAGVIALEVVVVATVAYLMWDAVR